MTRNFIIRGFSALALSLAMAGLTGCGQKKSEIKLQGSNTMAPIGSAWAEAFEDAKVSASGGGSGIGIAELTEGRIQICASSRAMKEDEKKKIKEKHGKDVKEIMVGYDALAIYTHNDNPLKEISIEQLHEIYSEGGSITTWEQVGPGGLTGSLMVLGRESTSGTYDFVHDAIVGKDAQGNKGKFRNDVAAQSSSTAIIDQLTTVKNAVGYDGMAYKTDKVKWLAVSKKTGEPAVLPSADDARSKKYPLARPLFLYTIGEPEGDVKKFIDFALSDKGQELLTKSGAVSLK